MEDEDNNLFNQINGSNYSFFLDEKYLEETDNLRNLHLNPLP